MSLEFEKNQISLKTLSEASDYQVFNARFTFEVYSHDSCATNLWRSAQNLWEEKQHAVTEKHEFEHRDELMFIAFFRNSDCSDSNAGIQVYVFVFSIESFTIIVMLSMETVVEEIKPSP